MSPAGWSPDGSSIYAYIGNNMLSIAAGGGQAAHRLYNPARHRQVSVSADGKKFVVSHTEMNSDVWE